MHVSAVCCVCVAPLSCVTLSVNFAWQMMRSQDFVINRSFLKLFKTIQAWTLFSNFYARAISGLNYRAKELKKFLKTSTMNIITLATMYELYNSL